MSPDTQQNLAYTLYFIISHNWQLLVYVGGSIIATYSALQTPTRGRILLMLGCAFLIFAFQYSKHIRDPLIEQTRTSLITERQSFRTEHILEVVLLRVLPLALPTLGWGLLLTGAYLELRPRKK